MAEHFETIVIGAGPGGYVAALRLAGEKQRVALVEAEQLGGTCLNRGCIPTKALLHSSEIVAHLRQGELHGIRVKDWKLDFGALMRRKNQVVARLRSGVAGLLKARQATVLPGRGKLTDGHTVEVTAADGSCRQVEADHIIIATGSEAAVPGFFPANRSRVMTSTEILDLEKLPASLLIIGAGYIGCEFATVFSELGTKVTMVEMLDRVLPMSDIDLSKTLAKVFRKGGIDIHTGVGVKELEVLSDAVRATLQDGEAITAELALVCTGRRPRTAGLGLESAGVATDAKGFIVIDDYCCTNVPHIFAIGDVTGKLQLAHVASRQANVAAHNILGREDTEDYAVVPSAVYTHPEIASVGLTLEQAREKGYDARAATFPMAASGMALAYAESTGFVKIIADRDDVILGAHIMCPHAADLAQQIATVMKAECTLHELHATIHAHPTFSEALAETVDILLGTPLHSH